MLLRVPAAAALCQYHAQAMVWWRGCGIPRFVAIGAHRHGGYIHSSRIGAHVASGVSRSNLAFPRWSMASAPSGVAPAMRLRRLSGVGPLRCASELSTASSSLGGPLCATASVMVSAAATIYATLILLLLVAQRRVIFPRPANTQDPAVTGGDVVRLDTKGDNAAYAVHFPARQAEAHTVAFFHGNADQIGWGPALLGRHLSEAYGVGFFGIEYPGYGLAPGSPSEVSIVGAAEQLLVHLTSEKGLGVPPEHVVLLGQSIGCTVAMEMALRGFGSRLVLITPFTSMLDMAMALYPFVVPVAKLAPYLLLDKFDNASRAHRVRTPTLVLHGTKDEVVPFEQGRKLAEMIPGAIFRPVHGGCHNNILFGAHSKDALHAIEAFAFRK